ncbi:MAG: PilN domain-containing protein [Candidatus Omnitrophica bacterium]|nr:PilN domain-containing protein [Candidatus Omnitrophota bacterium]
MGGFKIPLEVVIGSVGGVLLILIGVHIIFIVLIASKFAHHESLKKEWAAIKPTKDKVDTIITEMKALQKSYKSITEISGEDGIRWSRKLNNISDSLPRGVWLRKIAINEESFNIQGSAISKRADEMINVHTFTSALKQQKGFMDDFSQFDLGSIQRKTISNTEIAEFSIMINYNEEKDESENSGKN